MAEDIGAALCPRFSEQPVIHSREETVANSQLADEKRHSFYSACIGELTGVEVAEGRVYNEFKEFALCRHVISHDVNVAECASVKNGLVEDLPENILESTDNDALGKSVLQLLGAARVPGKNEVGVISVEGI